MELQLYVKEGEALKVLQVPQFVVKDLLRDRLSPSEVNRIHRLAEPVMVPETFKPGSVVVDFSAKTAQCFQSGLNLSMLEPTWKVTTEAMTLGNY